MGCRRAGQSNTVVRGILVLLILALALLTPQQYVAAGINVVAQGGALSAWGYNNGGSLGDGTGILRDEPVHVTGTGANGLSFIAFDGGLNHSLGLTTNGTVYAWGDNSFGQLGNVPAAFALAPQQVPGTGPGGIMFTAIAAGGNHSLGLTANGTAYAWGYNEYGQLGNGTSGGNSATPVQVSGTGPGGIVLTAIVGGQYHSLGLTANGTAYAWGRNREGQLGNGTSGDGNKSTTPVQVSGTGPGGLVLTALAGSDTHTLGLANDGTAYAWGEGLLGQLGNLASSGIYPTPQKVVSTGPSGIVLIAIAAGTDHGLGLAADGTGYAWGRNIEGQLGDGTSGAGNIRTVLQLIPSTGPGGIILTAIAAGGHHSLALTANGTAYGWGDGRLGQVGNGTNGAGAIQTTPVAVSGTGPSGVALTAIAAGNFHSLAGADGAVGNCAGFADLSASDPACPAVAALTQQGTIKGYATNPPTFGPNDNVQRAQVAAFLVRALGWQAHPTGPRAFTDLGGLVAELRTAALIVANTCDTGGLCVAYGYGDGRFGPTDPVSHAQVITFITRAFRLDPVQAWVPQPGDPQPYVGVPAVHDADVRTFVHYAGAIPDAPTDAAGWSAPASRAWVARLLYQALTVQP